MTEMAGNGMGSVAGISRQRDMNVQEYDWNGQKWHGHHAGMRNNMAENKMRGIWRRA